MPFKSADDKVDFSRQLGNSGLSFTALNWLVCTGKDSFSRHCPQCETAAADPNKPRDKQINFVHFEDGNEVT
jgi:hypothetical protein